MVRVMSCYQFESQSVLGLDVDVLAVTVTPSDILVVATGSHTLEVRDLSCGGKLLHTLPTVDAVLNDCLHYCSKGNYICVLETKTSRSGSVSTYVRVYLSWDKDPGSQPMRARIAGRVSPSSQSAGVSLEMIEIPTKKTPQLIACCQETGNLLVGFGTSLIVYRYLLKTHDISKHKFIDFEELLSLEVSYYPKSVHICEDLVAFLRLEELHVIRVGFSGIYEKEAKSKPLNIKQARLKTSPVRDHLPSDHGSSGDGTDDDSLECIIWDPRTFSSQKNGPLVAKFPSLLESHDFQDMSTEAVEVMGPTCLTSDNPVKVDLLGSLTLGAKIMGLEVSAETMLYLKLAVDLSDPSKAVTKDIICALMIPRFIKDFEGEEIPSGANPLWSGQHSQLGCVECLVSAEKESHLYVMSRDSVRRVQTFNYTGNLKHMVLERDLLYAMTDSALETYSTQSSRLYAPLSNLITTETCPAPNDNVYLIGYHPFVNVTHMCLSDRYLAVLTCNEGSSCSDESLDVRWTLYTLSIPCMSLLYKDLSETALQHQKDQIDTCADFLAMAHMVLCSRVATLPPTTPKIEELFRMSHLQLAEFHLLNAEDPSIPCKYLIESQLSVNIVIQKCQEVIRKEKERQELVHQTLLLYLDHWLATSEKENTLTQEAIDKMIQTYTQYCPEKLSRLVLFADATIKQNYYDRVLHAMKSIIVEIGQPSGEDILALIKIRALKGTADQAEKFIETVSPRTLNAALAKNLRVMLNDGLLSEMGEMIKDLRPDAFVDSCVEAIVENGTPFDTVLNVITNSCVLELKQDFLETFFSHCANSNYPRSCVPSHGLNQLVSIYLDSIECESDARDNLNRRYLGSRDLYGNRLNFLDKLPPFNGSVGKVCKRSETDTVPCNCDICNADLLSLQSLLCSSLVDEEQYALVRSKAVDRPGAWVSLLVITSLTSKATLILVDHYPSAVLCFARECLHDVSLWTSLWNALKVKLSKVSEDEEQVAVLSQLKIGVILELSQLMKPKDLWELLDSEEREKYESELKHCMDLFLASQLRDTIISTCKNMSEQ